MDKTIKQNKKDNNKVNKTKEETLKVPNLDDYKDVREYLIDMDNYIKKKDEPLRKSALKFLNNWLNKTEDTKFKALLDFKYKYLDYLPNDNQSKEYMIKNFNKYNEEFNLEFEYDEELFTTVNLLFFFKNMIRKLGFDLILDKKTGKHRYSVVKKK